MTYADIIGSLGVALLLLAFALNLVGKLPATMPAYSAVNFIGAALAGLASYMIAYWPFVVLESVWAGVSAVGWVNAVHARES